MMSLLEYANDVELSVEEIKKLCERLSIEYGDENYLLSDTEITLLDNLVEECKTEEKEPIEQEEIEDTLEEETYDKAESLAENSRFDLDNNISFEKVKSKQKRTSDSKKAFQAERKKMYKNKEKLKSNEKKVSDDIVLYKEGMTVLEIAEALNDNVTNIIKKLIGLGIMANQNQSIDFETTEVLVSDYKKILKKEETVDISNFENYEIEDKEEDLQVRPPIVTIMGHVDHGKTTLLDYIRKSKVASKEAGGITQAIGAYSVNYNEKNITFIDTPGHEAFTAMRARGASITDIVIIIVAADDGVMPQTKEAIDHAKAAGVPIIVAINKIDKPEANIDKVMSELTEMEEYKANPSRYATGAVIESRQDKQVGSIVSLIIQNGTLRLGDPIVVGNSFGKVRTLKNDRGENIVEAPPSTPVEVTGFSNLPSAGDKFMAFESEKEAKNIAAERTLRQKNKEINKASMSLEDLFGQIKEGMKEINIVLKADVNGSCEAVKSSLEKINVEGVKLSVIRAGVGAITESDIVLAKASNALVIGFNVRANTKTMDTAKENGIEIKTYNIIYKVVEDIENAMKGMLEPIYDEKVTGKLEIRQIFKFSKVGLIAGCHVLDGTIKNNSKARIIRDDIVIYDGKIKSLQHEKDQVKEVKKDMDCGITLESCNLKNHKLFFFDCNF